jgi:hypothetical protein
MIVGTVRHVFGLGVTLLGLVVNIFWAIYNIISLFIVVKALYYKFPENWNPQPPEYIMKRIKMLENK